MPYLDVRGAREVASPPPGARRACSAGSTCRSSRASSWPSSGYSGSGKTTLLSLIAGLLAPDAGEIRSRARPSQGPGPERGIVFQQYSLLPWLTVLRQRRPRGGRREPRPRARRAPASHRGVHRPRQPRRPPRASARASFRGHAPAGGGGPRAGHAAQAAPAWTSPSARSTPSLEPRSRTSSRGSGRRGGPPWCWSPTTWTRPSSLPTGFIP